MFRRGSMSQIIQQGNPQQRALVNQQGQNEAALPRSFPVSEEERRDELLRFLRSCYVAAGMFFTFTAWQWMFISHVVDPDFKFIIGGIVGLVIAFTVLFTLTVCVRYRRNLIFSYIMAVIFVESAALGIIIILPGRTLDRVGIATLVALPILFICYLIGACAKKKFLPGEIAMCLCLILFIVLSIILLALYIITDQPKYKTLYFALLGITMIPTAIYHSQITNGRRFYVPYEEYVNVGLTLYVNFLMFFSCCYYGLWVHEW